MGQPKEFSVSKLGGWLDFANRDSSNVPSFDLRGRLVISFSLELAGLLFFSPHCHSDDVPIPHNMKLIASAPFHLL